MPRTRAIDIDVDVHRVIEGARRTLSESEKDILRRLLLVKQASRERTTGDQLHSVRPDSTPPLPRPADAGSRARGLWSVRIGTDRHAAVNLKDAYRVLLEQLAHRQPDFLQRFAAEGGRSRRFLARQPEALYSSSPHLAVHAKPLADGWYFDTNVSSEQVAKRARVAARLAGLLYGRDVQILDNLREI